MIMGFNTLDKMMEPFHAGELFVIGGHEGVGVEACVASLLQHTLEEVGQQLGVTRERVRQIEAKALRKLRRDKTLLSFWRD